MMTHGPAAATGFAMILLGAISGSVPAQAGKFGCFQVTADSLNIRARPYSSAAILGAVRKGDILEKRKIWCTPRGYWCAVRAGGLEGYADKAYLTKIPCP